MKLLRRENPKRLKRRTWIEKIVMKSVGKKKDGSYKWPGEELYLKVHTETDCVLMGEQCDKTGKVYPHPMYPKRNLARVIWIGGIKSRKEV